MTTAIMLDLETWGTRPGCAIRSIGGVSFDPYRGPECGNFTTFYHNIDDASCFALGLDVDPGTAAWWLKQSPEARGAFLSSHRSPIGIALTELVEWYHDLQAEEVWAHGSCFDLPIIEHAMRLTDVTPPWRYRQIRDTRTVFAVAGYLPDYGEFSGVPHNAIDDAAAQAKWVQEAIAKISGGGE